ncbi:uncharacterized protein LOC135496283 [Lineus longissimus]|uniref:uncharacterized protein LOC135496283 n=1 Tax=Lineus longissimus TaxID=88925 RepID=UPI00315C9FFA
MDTQKNSIVQGKIILGHPAVHQPFCNPEDVHCQDRNVLCCLSSRLEDLEIPPPVRDHFTSHADDVIQEYSIENNWCYVLPSMKQGKVVHVCHKLPNNGPFRSYRDIKRHWKNSYGYRLPEDEDGVIYYQIYFKLIGEQLFTYPECCVRPRDINILPRTDPKPILQAFLSDLQNKISNLCGQKFHFQTKASFLVTSLNEVCKEQTNRSNLTTKMPMPAAGYRQAPPTTPVFQPKQTSTGNLLQSSAVSLSASSQVDPNGVINRQSFDSSSQLNGESVQNQAQLVQAENKKYNSREDKVRHPPPQRLATVTAESRPRIVPMFSSVKPRGIIMANRGIEEALPKTVPIFRPKAPSLDAKPTNASQKIQPFSQSFMSHPKTAEEPPRDVSSAITPSIPSLPYVGGQSRSSNVLIFAKKPSASSGQPVVKPQMQQPRLLGTGTMPGSKLKLKKLPTLTDSTGNTKHAMAPSRPSISLPPASFPNQGSNLNDSQFYQSSLHSVGSTPQSRVNVPAQKPEDGASKPKKPRVKQTVQEGIDVTLLANNNQLNKVNAATLTAWLKGRGIQCKAKDKKTDLMEKVKLALNIVSTEP